MIVRKLVAAALVFAGATATASAQPSTVFAVDLRAASHRLLTWPVNTTSTAGVTVVTTTPFNGFAMDFNTAGTTLFGINASTDVPNPNSFGTINTTTGAFTPIATVTGLPAGGSAGGLTIDPTSGTFYVNDGATLFTLNTTTGALTTVGAFGGAILNIDVAVHPTTGQMYGHDIGADTLLTIDKATGLATVIGPTGFASNFAQGMDFDPATGTLYATIYTGGGTGNFVSFDLTTGAGTSLFSTTALNAEMEMAVLAAAIPEPTSMTLMGLAVAGYGVRRWKKKK